MAWEPGAEEEDQSAAAVRWYWEAVTRQIEQSQRELQRLHSPPADGGPHPVDEAALRRWRRWRESEASREPVQESAKAEEDPATRSPEAEEAQEPQGAAAEETATAVENAQEEEEAASGAAVAKTEEPEASQRAAEEPAGRAKEEEEKPAEPPVSSIAAPEERPSSIAAPEEKPPEEAAAQRAADARKTAEESVAGAGEQKGAGQASATAGAASGAEKSSPGQAAPAKSQLEIALELLEKMKPASPDNEPTHGRNIWIVVGGADSGGIIVRQGKSIQSPECKARLVTGTKVEEMDVQGKRLHYRRLKGNGPDFGWVSLEGSGGKKLMEEYIVED